METGFLAVLGDGLCEEYYEIYCESALHNDTESAVKSAIVSYLDRFEFTGYDVVEHEKNCNDGELHEGI